MDLPSLPQPSLGSAGKFSVLLTGTSYPLFSGDWRGMFMERLLDALARMPNLDLQAWLPPGDLPASVAKVTTPDDDRWLRSLLESGGMMHLLRTSPAKGGFAAGSLLHRLGKAYRSSNADLFHINWLQNALALPQDGRPAVVTALGSDMKLLRLPMMRTALRRTFHARRTAICPNAEWMVAPLSDAFGSVAEVRCVPFGIDPDWYTITRECQPETHHWICVTRVTRGKIGPLFEWAAPLFQGANGRILHVIGPAQEAGVRIPKWIRYHEPATAGELKTRWFPMATGLLSVSQHSEGRPQVMLEAMAAGLPILASRIAAHEDVIEHGQTGWLCDDQGSFSRGMNMIEEITNNRAFGHNARAIAHSKHGTWADCAKRYSALYRELTLRP